MKRRLLLAGLAAPALISRAEAQRCVGPIYLTIDTGWSREAEMIADVLRRRGVRATLFVANERTHRGDRQLEAGWAPFWQARAAEGHAFASHTWRHWYFRNDAAQGVSYMSRQGEGSAVLDQAALCTELAQPVQALRALAPQARVLPLWRAPGGITTPATLRLAAACGLRHQGWSRTGFLGDELDSNAHPNHALLRSNLSNIRAGDVLVMHWGVRSRREPFGLIMEPLVTGLLQRGFCFELLPETGVSS